MRTCLPFIVVILVLLSIGGPGDDSVNYSAAANSSTSTRTETLNVAWQNTAATKADNLLSTTLTSSIVATKTTIKESSAFTVTMVVTNTGATTVTGVRPSSVDVNGTGWATLTKWPSPALANLASGKTVKFKLKYKAMLAGTVTLSGNAISADGNSVASSSPLITILPKKISAAAMTDDLGNAMLKCGKFTLPIQLQDEDTGSPIAGVSVAVAQDKKNKGRAVLVVADSLQRYPLQVIILHGPVTSSSALAPKPEVSSAPSASSPVVVSLYPASDSVITGVIKTLQTGLLPSFIESENDNKNFPQVILTVLKSLSSSKDIILPPPLRSVLPSKVSSQPVSSDQMNDILFQKATDAYTEAAVIGLFFCPILGLEEGLQHAAFHLVPDILNMGAANIYQMMGCTSLSLSEISFGGIIFEIVTPTGAGCSPADIPKGALQITATDNDGQPISDGSLELVSRANLGSGFRAVISDGTAYLPVPLDDYDWCLRSTGFEPQSGQTSVTDDTATINAVLQPKLVASGTINQDRIEGYGFLPEGTQFTVTPRFFDANGIEVACSGDVNFYAHNPVGTLVATVDSDTGLVTMQGGCGAAGITAWCGGVESRRLLVSTDCDGKLPPNPRCVYSIFPTAASFTASGGDGSVTVAASDDTCAWIATSNVGWITITSGDSDSGDGTVGYSVAENSGTSKRVGKITIAGKTFTVTQTGTSASPATFDGVYEANVTTVTPLGTTVGQATFLVSGGFVFDLSFTFTGTVGSSGNFIGTTTVCQGCDPLTMTGTFSLTEEFTISGASGSVSQTIVAYKVS